MLKCPVYDGPERTPELIAKVMGITVNGKRPAPRKPTPADVAKYLRAEKSLLIEGPVPPPIYEQRVAQCTRRAVGTAGREYCTGCGCGARTRAYLDIKMHMPNIECSQCGIEPHPGEGRAALKRIGGLRKQVGEIMRSAIKEHGLSWSDVRRMLRSDAAF